MKKYFWDHFVEVHKRAKFPWRPSRQEIAIMEKRLARRMGEKADKSKNHSLVLGVTMEIVNMAWPPQTRLTVVDNSEAMIREFWQPGSSDAKHLVQADWIAPPFKSHQFDIIIGDGVFNIPDYPDGYRHLAQILSHLLKPDGLLLTRVHMQSEPNENPGDIAAQYISGKITDYHELRFRFITAMQHNACQGVFSSKQIIDAHLAQFGISLSELYRTTGYIPIPADENYPASAEIPAMKATYPTQDEFLSAVREHLQLMDVSYANHPLAHRCPIFAFEPIRENLFAPED